MLTADNERGTCNLTGIALDNKNFELHDLNVHFGCDTDRGSEHTVDGKPFPAEVRVDANNILVLATTTLLAHLYFLFDILYWLCYYSTFLKCLKFNYVDKQYYRSSFEG